MKRIYLVDSENVGDIWVPLLVASQPDEEVIVFYTQKSPHMNYENVRLLKETEKEAEFIKCFEGSNALDFQLVTQLGYLLCENQANSYVIVTVTKDDYGSDHPLAGMEFQRRLEKKAWEEGGGNVPIQRFADFCTGTISVKTGNVTPNIKGKYVFGNVRNIFPPELAESIESGIRAMGKKIIEQRDAGKGVILISADLNEIMELSDSILVMCGGQAAAYFEDAKKVDEFELGNYMLGLKHQEVSES